MEDPTFLNRRLTRGSKSLVLKIEGGVAKATVKRDTGEPRVRDETTFLYQRAGALIQSLADRTGERIVQKFGTVNLKMKMWMREKGVGLGFSVTEDEEDGRTLKAERVFEPR